MRGISEILACPVCRGPLGARARCDSCDTRDLRSPAIMEDSRYTLEWKRYEKVAAAGPAKYHGLADTRPAWRAGRAANFLAHNGIDQFVNLGPGFGELEKRCHNEFDIISIDPCRGFLDRIEEAIPAVHTVQGVAEYLPLQDESVDCFVAQSTFQSIVDRVRFLYELGRVMAPGSLFLLTIAYAWNYPRKPQDGFNILKADEHRVLHLFLEEMGFTMQYEIVNVARQAVVNSLDEGDYLWIIGRK